MGSAGAETELILNLNSAINFYVFPSISVSSGDLLTDDAGLDWFRPLRVASGMPLGVWRLYGLLLGVLAAFAPHHRP